ncbi:hypothetical protein CSKR_201571 [Clonorchis sinensis]|uniref:Uncharacterized protein n=1 Tax=Clonorchis sinensis TaxID=79923 RepID=A0A8T1MRK9_CLOSI|nr:hypothetical protein CSKR_201571 [Clonorchis sinensis]
MRDRLLLLLILGVGLIKIYEEYDEEEGDEFGSPDPIKHKHSRRDTFSVVNQMPLKALSEETVEAMHFGGRIKMSECKDIPDECSCRRLKCFGEDSCGDQLSETVSEVGSYGASNHSKPLIWIKNCRQAILLGERLCECRRFLYHKDEYDQMEQAANAAMEIPSGSVENLSL